ncbi:twin-arginine translocase subunit TatC [Staphylococcus aureus]
MFYQLWAFIAPGLHNNERQFIYKYSFFSVLLFCAGLVAFFISVGFPIIIQFALKLSLTLNISPVIGFKAYFVELIRWLFTFGILFQLPILFIHCKIRSYRYHIIEALLKIYLFRLLCAGKYHCTTDLTLNILLTLPLILLFEFSMFIVKFTCRGKPPTH